MDDVKQDRIVRQVKFLDLEFGDCHGGIKLENGDVICGCCGGIFESGEENETWKLVEEYQCWVDLDKTILDDTWFKIAVKGDNENGTD